MAADHRSGGLRSDDSKELGYNGGNAGSGEEESGQSVETAVSAGSKEMPLKRADQPSPPSPEDAVAHGSGVASPVGKSPRDGVAFKTKVTTSKRVKKSPPVSQVEDEVGDSGDASPATVPLANDIADAGQNKRAATPMRGKKRSPPPQQEEERPEKRGTGPDAETVAASAPQRKKNKKKEQQQEKKPAIEQSWSRGDELKILNALALHAKSHNGALLESSHLLANLIFDKVDANEDKLNDKIRKLRSRYGRWLSQGSPSDDRDRELFDLSKSLWGPVDEDESVEPTSRDLSVLSELYPHLSKEVKAYAETHSSGDLIMAMFMTLDDEKARNLDAKCKKQHIDTFKFELGQASLTNEWLSALSSSTR